MDRTQFNDVTESARRGYGEASRLAGKGAKRARALADKGLDEATAVVDDAKSYAADVADDAQGAFNRGLDRVVQHARENPWLHAGIWGAAALGIGLLIGRRVFAARDDA